MIYIIDDKINRQIDYGWDANKFARFLDKLCPIHTYNDLSKELLSSDIFSDFNTVLCHESFHDNSVSDNMNSSLELKNNLYKYARLYPNANVVFFSGSKSSRKIDKNVAYMPVSALYQNLEAFATQPKSDKYDLRYLLYGSNFEIEEILISKLESANKNFGQSVLDEPQTRNFVALTIENEIDLVFRNATYETFFLDEVHNLDVTDEYMSEIIGKWFDNNEFDNIFIPLCFGPILSDYNGLRFAAHLRCTESINRLQNIFIYSFVDFTFVLEKRYFDILKTKNVQLIDYNKLSFFNAANSKRAPLSSSELPNEIRKLKLDPPKDYDDNHSIINEWAIYRWANTLNTYDKDIDHVSKKVSKHLYFKYLKTMFPPSDIFALSQEKLKIIYEGSPRILYIDDEANKGWYEILCALLFDINKLDFHYLDDEFIHKTQEEIISISIEEVIKKDVDLVILDFRLHQNDFFTENVQNITGLRLLKEIKKINPGIQVVVFSATNKLLNLQVLQEAGIDGFVMKESPELSLSSHSTSLHISKMLITIGDCLHKTFLKDFYLNFASLSAELIPRKRVKSDNPLPNEFVDEVLKWLEITYQLLNKEINQSSLTASFVFLFSVLENLSNRVINVEKPILVNNNLYKFEFRGTNQELCSFSDDSSNSGGLKKSEYPLVTSINIPWTQKILNTIDYLGDNNYSVPELNKIVKLRNDIIHANTTTGDKIYIDKKYLILLNTLICNGLKNVK